MESTEGQNRWQEGSLMGESKLSQLFKEETEDDFMERLRIAERVFYEGDELAEMSQNQNAESLGVKAESGAKFGGQLSVGQVGGLSQGGNQGANAGNGAVSGAGQGAGGIGAGNGGIGGGVGGPGAGGGIGGSAGGIGAGGGIGGSAGGTGTGAGMGGGAD